MKNIFSLSTLLGVLPACQPSLNIILSVKNEHHWGFFMMNVGIYPGSRWLF